MKFTLNNDHQASRLMNTLLSGLMVFILLFLVTDLIVKTYHYGFTTDAIATMLYGNEEEFIEPLPFASLLEGVHADIFFAMMTLLTLGAVYGRTGRSKRLRIILVNLMMLTALTAMIAPVLAYVHSAFWITVWIITAVSWHAIAMLVALIALWRLRFP